MTAMKKKTTLLVRAVALVTCLVNAVGASAYDFVSNNIYYNITGTSPATVEVTYKDENFNSYSGSVIIPSAVTYGGVRYSVTTIGEMAFYISSNLTAVYIPNSVDSVAWGAFAACTNLKSVDFPYGVKELPNAVCSGCINLESVTIPNSVIQIGPLAFSNCRQLKSLVIPNSVVHIADQAFNNCGLTRLTIGNSVDYIGNQAFSGCPLAEVQSLALTPPTISEETFSEPENASLIVRGPYSKSLYEAADYWKEFQTINTAQEYDFYADGFYFLITSDNTAAVTRDSTNPYTGSVSIPSAVTYNGKTYTVTAIGEGAFAESGITSVVIPNTVKEINLGAFFRCQNLTNVTLGNGITTIGIEAFALCNQLSSIVIPNSVTTIDIAAFAMTGLTEVIIPNSVLTIGNSAFGNCTSLASVTIGSSVIQIGASAFIATPSLQTVTCLAMMPPGIDETTFDYDMIVNGTLYVPSDAVNNYKNDDIWRFFYHIEGITMTVRGDVNGDGSVNIADVTALIDLLLTGGTAPASADATDDGSVNIADVTALIDYLLSGSW